MFAVVWHVRWAEIIFVLITLVFCCHLANKADKVIVSGSKSLYVYSQFRKYRPLTVKVMFCNKLFNYISLI